MDTTNATLYQHLSFDFIRDIVPIAMISSLPLVMLVNESNPAKTVPEFIAWAKANPGKVNMASGGTGSASHIGGEFFKTMTGVEMQHVPYKGGAPAITDLMGGTIQVYFSPLPESIGVVKGGKVRALAVTTAKRVPSLPDVPTVGESVSGFEITTWQGIGAPKSTPSEIVAALNKEINAGLADPEIKARILQLGGEPSPVSAAAFEKRVVDETARWAKVIRDARIPLQ